MRIKDILSDADYQGLSRAERRKVWLLYFDDAYGKDPDYLGMGRAEQRRARDMFADDVMGSERPQVPTAEQTGYTPEKDIMLAGIKRYENEQDAARAASLEKIKPDLGVGLPVDKINYALDPNRDQPQIRASRPTRTRDEDLKEILSGNELRPDYMLTPEMAHDRDELRSIKSIERKEMAAQNARDKRAHDIEIAKREIEREYQNNYTELATLSVNRRTWDNESRERYASLLQRQAEIETDFPRIAMGMNEIQYKAFNLGKRFAKEHPVLAYPDAFLFGTVSLATGLLNMVAPGNPFFDYMTYYEQGVSSEMPTTLSHLVRGTIASVPMNIAMMVNPVAGAALTFTDITSRDIKQYYDAGTLDAANVMASIASGAIQTVIEYMSTESQLAGYRDIYRKGGTESLQSAVLKETRDAMMPSFSRVARSLAHGALTEGLEEVSQNVADRVVKMVMLDEPMPGNKQELMEWGKELALDFAGGALGGFLMGGGATGVQIYQHNEVANYIKHNANTYESIQMLQQSIDLINNAQSFNDIDTASDLLREAKAKAVKEGVEHPRLLQGFNLASSAIMASRANQVQAIKAANKEKAAEITELKQKADAIRREGFEPGFETEQGAKLYDLEDQIKVKEREYKKGLQQIHSNKELEMMGEAIERMDIEMTQLHAESASMPYDAEYDPTTDQGKEIKAPVMMEGRRRETMPEKKAAPIETPKAEENSGEPAATKESLPSGEKSAINYDTMTDTELQKESIKRKLPAFGIKREKLIAQLIKSDETMPEKKAAPIESKQEDSTSSSEPVPIDSNTVPSQTERAMPAEPANTENDKITSIELDSETKQSKSLTIGKINEDVDRADPKESKRIPEEALGGDKTVVKGRGKGSKYKIRHALIPLKDILVSHDADFNENKDYPQELQPRDRSKGASRAKNNQVTAELDPYRLMDNYLASEGRPIVVVDKDGRIIALTGNGRLIALKRRAAGEYDGIQEYEQTLREHLEDFGINDQDTAGKVLVGVYYGDADLIQLANTMNESEGDAMSPVEQAAADAKQIANLKKHGDDIIEALDINTEDVMSAANTGFLKLFAERLGLDLTKYQTADGKWNKDFRTRVENALFMYIFNNNESAKRALSAWREDETSNMKSVLTGVMSSIKLIAKYRNAVEKYKTVDLDITVDLLEAIDVITRLRKEGKTLEQEANEMDLFSDGNEAIPSDKLSLYQAIAMIKTIKRGTEFIKGYYSEAMDLADPNQMSFLYDPNTSKEDFLNQYTEGFIKRNEKKKDDRSPAQRSATETPAKTHGEDREGSGRSDRSEEDVVSGRRLRTGANGRVSSKISDSVAEEALIGLFKSHIAKTERDGRKLTITFKDGRKLTLDRLNKNFKITMPDGRKLDMYGRTYSKTIDGTFNVFMDLVDGLNGGNRTLYHEAFHVAWKLFMTTDQIDMISRYYAKKLGPEASIVDIEEAAANAAQNWLGNRAEVPPGFRNMFRRFWDRVRHALVSLGLANDNQKIEDIFWGLEQDRLQGKGTEDKAVTENLNNETEVRYRLESGDNKYAFNIMDGYKPSKTVKGYKAFVRDKDGNLKPLFVSNDISIPIGKWLEAKDTWHFQAENGLYYVPTGGEDADAKKSKKKKDEKKTGVTVPIPSEKVRAELIKRGFLPKGSKAKTVKAVAYRPGWHGSLLPLAKQLGNQVSNIAQKTGASFDGYEYSNVYQEDIVFAEVEFDMSNDYQGVASKETGLQRMPEKGGYQFTTNKKNEDPKNPWFISGAIKVGRVLDRSEVNELVKKAGLPIKKWRDDINTSKGEGVTKDGVRYRLDNAYHGSGALFNRFDVEYIGTGEGAQAFGWGIYVTENEAVARDYANRIGGRRRFSTVTLHDFPVVIAIDSIVDDTSRLTELVIEDYKAKHKVNPSHVQEYEYAISHYMRKLVAALIQEGSSKNDLSIAMGAYRSTKENFDYEAEYAGTRKLREFNLEALKALDDFYHKYIENSNLSHTPLESEKSRTLYTLSVWENHQEDVLDWYGEVTDEQLAKIQGYIDGSRIDPKPNIKEEIKYKTKWLGNEGSPITGEDVYYEIFRLHDGSLKAASQFLLRAGIDGIKYPVNATSGGTGNKGYNYVVFDDSQITILETTRYRAEQEKSAAKPKLVKTEWRSKLEDVPHKIEGSIVARRSDWDKSLVSELSGREIVHVYWIDNGDGEVKPYGIQSAAKIMGWSKAETGRKIRQLINEHKAEEAKIKAWRSEAREHKGAASPRAALLPWEPLQAHKEQDFWAAIDRDFVFAHKDNTYRAIPKNQSEHIEAYRREGWDIQSTDQARGKKPIPTRQADTDTYSNDEQMEIRFRAEQAENTEAERQMAEVRAKYESTEGYELTELEDRSGHSRGFSKGMTQVHYKGKAFHKGDRRVIDMLLAWGKDAAQDAAPQQLPSLSTQESDRLFNQFGSEIVVVFDMDVDGKWAPEDADAGRYYGYDEFRVSMPANEALNSISQIILSDEFYEYVQNTEDPDIDDSQYESSQDYRNWVWELINPENPWYGKIVKASDSGYRADFLNFDDGSGDSRIKYKDGYMKAPNGKPTNLNERQWLQVRTKAFKDWFGDWENDPKNASKVVDENGEPMVVYHGTIRQFNSFSKTAKSRHIELPGFFFTPSAEIAENFAQDGWGEIRDHDGYIVGAEGGQIYPVFLSTKHPNIIDVNDPRATMTNYHAILTDINNGIMRGHDGVIINGWGDGSGDTQMAVFSPTQIKSATANVGNFDPQNPDIRYRIEDTDLDARLKRAHEMLKKYKANVDPKEASEKIAMEIAKAKNLDPSQADEKIGRMIRAAYREGEGKAKESLAAFGIAETEAFIQTNKPDGTDKQDLTFHMEEALEYAADMGLSEADVKSLGTDRFTYYLMGLNMYAYGNELTQQLNEKYAEKQALAAKGITNEALDQEISNLISLVADARLKYENMKGAAGRLLQHARWEKSNRIKDLIKIAEVITETRDAQIAEINAIEAEMAELNTMLTELEKEFELLLDDIERLSGSRFKSDSIEDLRERKRLMAEQRAEMKNRMEVLKHRLSKAREGLQTSEKQNRAIREQLDKAGQIEFTEEEQNILKQIVESGVLNEEQLEAIGTTMKTGFRPTATGLRAIAPLTGSTSDLTPKQAALIQKILDHGKKPPTVTEFPLMDADWIDVVSNAFYQIILSSPVTHARNIIGNEANLALENIVNTVLGRDLRPVINSILSAKEGVGNMKKAWKHAEAYMKKYNLDTNSRIMKKFTTITRSLAAEDAFYYSRNYAAQITSIAIAEAKRTGKSADYLLRNPTLAMIKQAEYEAARGTWNYDPEGILGYITKAIETGIGMAQQGGKLGKISALLFKMNVMPFTRVVANVLNTAMDWSPVGYLGAVKYATGLVDKEFKLGKGITIRQRKVWTDEKGNAISSPFKKRDTARQLARATMGTIMLSLAYMLLEGIISGSGPDDWEERRQLMETGWRPNSIKIAGRWHSYMMLPIAPMLSAIANFQERRRKPGARAEEVLAATVMGMANTILDQSFLSNLAQLMEAITGNNHRYLIRAAADTPTRVIPISPNLLRVIADAVNDKAYAPETFIQYLMYSGRPWTNGWIKDNIPARIDVFGREAKKTSSFRDFPGSPVMDGQPLYVYDKNDIPHDMRSVLNTILGAGLKIPSTNAYEARVGDDQFIKLKGFDKEQFLRQRGFYLSMGLLSHQEDIEYLAKEGDIDAVKDILQKIATRATRDAKREMIYRYIDGEMRHKYSVYSKSRNRRKDEED